MTEKVVKRMQSPVNGTVPNPDPTERTVEQLLREIATSREIVESKATGDRQVFETRLGGMDTAIELLQKASDKIPQFIKDQVSQLQSLHDEKIDGKMAVVGEKIKSLSDVTSQQFISINDKFAEKDKAVSVGLQAQKESAAAEKASSTEATEKMEGNFTKLLDQGREMLAEGRRNTELQINDIKSRLDKGEGRGSVSDPATADTLRTLTVAITNLGTARDESRGGDKASSKTSATIALAISGAVGFVVIMSAIVGLVAFMATRAPAPVYLPAPQSAVTR